MKRMKVNGAILLPVVVVLFCSTAIAEASAADYFSRNAEG